MERLETIIQELESKAGEWFYSFFSNRLSLMCMYASVLLIFKDPRVKDWFLMDSPVLTYGMVLLYLLLVFVGPRFMKNREAFNLRGVLLLYNFSLVILSLYMCYEVRQHYSTPLKPSSHF